jgi:hypothetical protein
MRDEGGIYFDCFNDLVAATEVVVEADRHEDKCALSLVGRGRV